MKLYQIFLLFLIVWFGSGCSMQSGEKLGKLRIFADLKNSTSPNLFETFSGDFQAFSGPPSTLSEFDCIGLNVTGPGIPPSNFKAGSQPELEFDQAWNLGKSCNYPGKFSNFARNVSVGVQKSFSVEVPSGPRRLVQVVGIKDVDGTGQVCNFFDQGKIPPPEYEVEPYELGRVRIDQLQSSQSFSISSFWDSLPQAVKQSRFFDCQNCPPVTGQNQDDGFVDLGTGGYLKWGQSFKVPNDIHISEISLLLSKTAGTDRDIKVTIFSEVTLNPGSPISSSFYVDDQEVGLVKKITKKKLPTPIFLTAGTQYWLVVEQNTGTTGSIKIHVNTSSTYPFTGMRYENSGWYPHTGGVDMQFTLFSNCQP